MENTRAIKQNACWALWRLDDNGNRFVVAVFANQDEAEATARTFEAHGHKQSYWAWSGSRARLDAIERAPLATIQSIEVNRGSFPSWDADSAAVTLRV